MCCVSQELDECAGVELWSALSGGVLLPLAVRGTIGSLLVLVLLRRVHRVRDRRRVHRDGDGRRHGLRLVGTGSRLSKRKVQVQSEQVSEIVTLSFSYESKLQSWDASGCWRGLLFREMGAQCENCGSSRWVIQGLSGPAAARMREAKANGCVFSLKDLSTHAS